MRVTCCEGKRNIKVETVPEPKILDQRDAIVRALKQTRYNKTKAAQLLGMTFRSLRYRIKKLGIE